MNRSLSPNKSRSSISSRKSKKREAMVIRVENLRAVKSDLGGEEDRREKHDDTTYFWNGCSLPTKEELLDMNDSFANLFRPKLRRRRNALG